MFYSYLTTPATLIAVILPLGLSLAFLMQAWKSGSLPRWHVAAICAALVPVSYSLSYWTFSGYHVQNLFLVSLVLWCARREVTPKVAYALVFLHTAAVDIAGSLAYAAKHVPTMDGWYAGIGGGGALDLLVILPLIGVAAVVVITAYANWRAPDVSPSFA